MDRPRAAHHDRPVASSAPHPLEAAGVAIRQRTDAVRIQEVEAQRQIDAARERLAIARTNREQAVQERDRSRDLRRALAGQVAWLQGHLARLTKALAAETQATTSVATRALAATEATSFATTMRDITTAARMHTQRWRDAAQRAVATIGAWRQTTAATQTATQAHQVADQKRKAVEEAARSAWSRVIQTNLSAGSTRQTVAAHHDAIRGVHDQGLVRYLARATAVARQVIQAVHQPAVAAGQARAGRHPAICRDSEEAARRARRAERARDRRRKQAAVPGISTSDAASARRASHRDQRRERRAEARTFIDPAVDGSRPAVRQHEERLAALPTAAQGPFLAHLIDARKAGHAAAIREANGIASLPHSAWHRAASAIPLGAGARLIAVRGGDPSALAAAMLADDQAMERWLGEPGLERNRRYGTAARLTHHAGHIVAAWSPALNALAVSGDLDGALAFEVDRLIARLGIAGHRVVAILHVDSESGHPHLHLVYSRVRDSDHSLWSLSGRERIPALWLHGRTTTVLARGKESLIDDVDALAGTAPAARAGERLLWEGRLAATRRHLDGTDETVPLQGPIAAQRLAAVGSFSSPQHLAGGIWRFGTGADPGKMREWHAEMTASIRSGDEAARAHLAQHRPTNRGYWLTPDRTAPPGMEWRHSSKYGWYLARVAKAA